MDIEQDDTLRDPSKENNKEKEFDPGIPGSENFNVFAPKESKSASGRPEDNDVATNDGSVIETLDTAFHDKPGWSEGENISGSNRAGYYEERSYGKSDDEEELDARDDQQSA